MLLLLLLPYTAVGSQAGKSSPATTSVVMAVNSSSPPLSEQGSSTTALPPSSLATASSTPATSNNTCSCGPGNNASMHQLEKATKMKEQIKNKTGIISKIHHRATHSEDALWASVTLSALLVLLFVAVLHSRMWLDRTFINYAESQPVRYEQYNKKSEITTRQMLKSRARNLVAFFDKRRGSMTTEAGISMETFVHTEDTVDFVHKALLDSSCSSACSEGSDSSDEDEIFSINKYTGEWEGSSQTKQLLRKRRGVRQSSVGSEDEPMNSSLTRELKRLSSSSDHKQGEDVEQVLIQIG